MTLSAVVANLNLGVRCGEDKLSAEVTGAHVSDLLSDVIAHAKPGALWVTLQVHPNIIAVAVLKELAGIILVGGREPDPETLRKAAEEKIPLLTTPLPAFELAGKLYQLIGEC